MLKTSEHGFQLKSFLKTAESIRIWTENAPKEKERKEPSLEELKEKINWNEWPTNQVEQSNYRSNRIDSHVLEFELKFAWHTNYRFRLPNHLFAGSKWNWTRLKPAYPHHHYWNTSTRTHSPPILFRSKCVVCADNHFDKVVSDRRCFDEVDK